MPLKELRGLRIAGLFCLAVGFFVLTARPADAQWGKPAPAPVGAEDTWVPSGDDASCFGHFRSGKQIGYYNMVKNLYWQYDWRTETWSGPVAPPWPQPELPDFRKPRPPKPKPRPKPVDGKVNLLED